MLVTEVPAQSSWCPDNSSEAGKTYYYAVTAIDAARHESAFSAELKVVLGQYDPVPVPGTQGARVQPDQLVRAGEMVILSAGVWNPDNKALSYAWSQTLGLAVAVAGQTAAQASFIAPIVAQDTWFAFALTVTDRDRGSATDSV